MKKVDYVLSGGGRVVLLIEREQRGSGPVDGKELGQGVIRRIKIN
jgi:hypothetical protein